MIEQRQERIIDKLQKPFVKLIALKIVVPALERLAARLDAGFRQNVITAMYKEGRDGKEPEEDLKNAVGAMPAKFRQRAIEAYQRGLKISQMETKK